MFQDIKRWHSEDSPKMEARKNYLLIENEDSVTSVGSEDSCKVIYTKDKVKIKNGAETKKDENGVQTRRSTTFNIDLLKAAFLALGQTQSKDTEDQTVQEINLSFCDLSYSVKHGIRRGEL